MSGRVYSGFVRLVVVSAGALGFALLPGGVRGLASAPQTASAPVAPAQAAPFVGDWTVTAFSQMGPATFRAVGEDRRGEAAATVGSDGQAAVTVPIFPWPARASSKVHNRLRRHAGADGDDAHSRRAGSQGGPGDDGRPVRNVRDGGETCARRGRGTPGTRRRVRRRTGPMINKATDFAPSLRIARARRPRKASSFVLPTGYGWSSWPPIPM